VTWQVFSLVAWADSDTFWVVVSFASLALSFAVFYEVEGLKSKVWGWSSKVWDHYIKLEVWWSWRYEL
jgi:hypothetical protein